MNTLSERCARLIIPPRALTSVCNASRSLPVVASDCAPIRWPSALLSSAPLPGCCSHRIAWSPPRRPARLRNAALGFVQCANLPSAAAAAAAATASASGDSERSPCDQQATCKTDQPRVITTSPPTSSPRRIVPPRAMLEPSGYSRLDDSLDKKKANAPARTCPVSHAPFCFALPCSRSGQQFAALAWARCTPITSAPPRSLHAVLMSWHCRCHLSSIPANTLVHVQPCYLR